MGLPCPGLERYYSNMEDSFKGTRKSAPDCWPEISVHHPTEMAEAVDYFLFEIGAEAVLHEEPSEAGGFRIARAGYSTDRSIEELKLQIAEFLDRLTEIFDPVEPPWAEFRHTQSGDWQEKWKEGLEPLEIGRRLVVKPSWCDYPSGSGRVVIELDPGQAFGTGRHASTYMCLEFLDELFSGSEEIFFRMVDVGTGSGILSLAAAALGGPEITALDNDPLALPVAADNLAANGLLGRVFLVCAGPEAIRGSYDLVVANLTSADLLNLALELERLTGAGGYLVLSGVLTDQAEEVIEGFTALGLMLERRKVREEWTALLMARPRQP